MTERSEIDASSGKVVKSKKKKGKRKRKKKATLGQWPTTVANGEPIKFKKGKTR